MTGITDEQMEAARSTFISPNLPAQIRGLYEADLLPGSIQTMLNLAGDLIQELIDLRTATPAPVVDVEKLVMDARAEGWEACKSEVFATPCWFNTETQTGGFDFGDDEDGNAVETGAYMHLRTVLGVNPYLNGGAK